MSMPTYLFTSNEAEDNLLEQVATNRGVQVFRGSLKNKLDRWLQGFETFGISRAHLIDVDDPFFSRARIRQSLKLLEGQVVAVLPSKISDRGEASEGTSIELSALRMIASSPNFSVSQDFDVVPWRSLLPSNAILRMTGAHDFPRFRLTLDYDEDYKLLRQLAETFGPLARRQLLEKHLLANPSQIEMNFFRNEQFLKNKQLFLSENFRHSQK